jgi:hypothetical protein
VSTKFGAKFGFSCSFGKFGAKFGDADSDTYAGDDSGMNASGFCISAEGLPE